MQITQEGDKIVFTQIIKRDGRMVDFNVSKIEQAIAKAMNAIGSKEINDCRKLAKMVEIELEEKFVDNIPDVESVQDIAVMTTWDKIEKTDDVFDF